MKVKVFDIEWGGPVTPPTVAETYEVPEDVIAGCENDEDRNNAAGNWLAEKIESETGYRVELFSWDFCK